jgi:hypothetical protein
LYSLCEEGLRFLEQLDEDEVFATVVIAGRYRSGKSFLLNRGLLETPAKKGFVTGNSVNACTRGIWIYPTPLETPERKSFLVLDTEGTASMEAQAEHDADALPILITTSERTLAAVQAALAAQLAALPTRAVAAASLARGFAVLAASLDEALALSDLLAPEHLELQLAGAAALGAAAPQARAAAPAGAVAPLPPGPPNPANMPNVPMVAGDKTMAIIGSRSR